MNENTYIQTGRPTLLHTLPVDFLFRSSGTKAGYGNFKGVEYFSRFGPNA